ncbi:diamine N-acetyltransferase [Burkholderiales bacterium]|nr:diamine N-acetyltransferase [Burkholderiales bacterium]
MADRDARFVTLRRPSGPEDAAGASGVHAASRVAAMPWLARLHGADEDLAWMRDVVFPSQSVWLACADETIVGIAAREGTWLTQLYVAPGWTGCGVGTRLLERIAGESPVLDLWTFRRNDGARRFYERHGFVAVEFGDGSGNEEREPDVRYRRPIA